MGKHNIQDAIIEGLRASDDRIVNEAISACYKQYFSAVRRFVLNNKGAQRDVDDIFQEVVTTLYQKVRKEREWTVENLSNYLTGIAKFKWFGKIRKDQRLPLADVEHYEVKEEILEDVTDEQWELVESVVSKLSAACQQILTLFYFDKMSMAEIASKLNYNGIDVVKTKKYKCLSNLKEKVKAQWANR